MIKREYSIYRSLAEPIIIFLTVVLPVFVGSGPQTASTVEPPRNADMSFHPEIKNPVYPPGKGPVVLVDEAHNNFHTAVGTYLPFARLLERDGYVIKRGKEKI